MRIFLTGATGFVGSHMLKRLLDEGHSVRALVRDPERAAKSAALSTAQGASSQTTGSQNPASRGNVEFLPGDIVSGAGLDAAIAGCEAVIHLVGIIVEKGANTFEAVHHIGTRNVVEAAKRTGVRRFVHMSALGVRADAASAYQITKWKGEEEVRRSGIPFCILRPSIIFGPGDGFVTQMMDVMRKAPLFRPVPGAGLPTEAERSGKMMFRLIFTGDITFCFARALTAEAATNQTIELGGADELSLNDVLKEIARCAGVRKPAVHIPMPLMFLGAAVMQTILPNPPVTVDQLRMLKEGSTCDIAPMIRIFGLKPHGFAGCGR